MISQLPQREEFLRKKRKRRIIKYSIVLGLLVLVIALLSYIAHRPSIRISEVGLSGGVLVTEKDLEAKTLEYLKGSYLWIFPKDNAFWYPKGYLKKHLTENFKRIDTIETNLENFHTLSIKITERKPIATWCKEQNNSEVINDLELSSTTTLSASETSYCYFIDQNSTIFAPAPFFSGDAYFKYYGLVTEENPIGLEYIASTTKFTEIAGFVEDVKSLLLRPQRVIAKENDEFSLIISGGGEIFFGTKRPLSSVFENLETLLKSPEFKNSSTSNLPIEYIDLRYGNKLFYKLRE